MELTSRERNFLRKRASDFEPIVRIGKFGLTETQLESIKQVINKKELIKVKILNNSEEKISYDLAKKIENYTGAVAVYLIGHTIIFFKKKVNDRNEKGPITQEFYDFRNRGKK